MSNFQCPISNGCIASRFLKYNKYIHWKLDIGNWKFVLLFIVLFYSSSHANVLDLTKTGSGARSIALGKCQVAVSDVGSIFVNPAGIAALERFSLTSMYSNFNNNVAYSMLGGVFPIKEGVWGCVGVGQMMATLGGIFVTSSEGQSAALSTTDYSNRILVVSYGKEFSPILNFGAAAKLYSKSFSSLQGSSADGLDFDAGIIIYPNEKTTFGLVLQNFFLGQMLNSSSLKEDIPVNIKMGINFKASHETEMLLDYDSNKNIHGGIEWRPNNSLSLRTGCELAPFGPKDVILNYSLGVGLIFKGLDFNYAYAIDSILPENSTHYFSISFTPLPLTVENPPMFFADKNKSKAL